MYYTRRWVHFTGTFCAKQPGYHLGFLEEDFHASTGTVLCLTILDFTFVNTFVLEDHIFLYYGSVVPYEFGSFQAEQFHARHT